MQSAVRGLNLAIRFVLELCMFSTFAWWGFSTGANTFVKIIAGAGLALAAIVWGIFLSPKAKVKLPVSVRVVMELLLFGIAAWMLNDMGEEKKGIALVVIFIINRAILLMIRA